MVLVTYLTHSLSVWIFAVSGRLYYLTVFRINRQPMNQYDKSSRSFQIKYPEAAVIVIRPF